MLSEHRQYIIIAPRIVSLPDQVILLVVLGFSHFGDALRDALDVTLTE